MKRKSLFLMLPLIASSLIGCDNNNNGKADNDFTLSESSLSLYVGETKTIYARTNPESQYCTWISSDSTIATVNTIGKITAISVGSCEITATVGDISHTCELTVSADDIVLDKSSLEVNILTDNSYQFTCSYAHSSSIPSVTWSVDDDSVGTVSTSGLLTLKSTGEVNVTASLTDEIKASCKVTVTGPNDYYVLTSAGNADVIANPNKWFYHTDGNASHFEATYYNGLARLSMDSSGANKTYLRYMPSDVPNIYGASAMVTVSKKCVVRLGGGASSESSFVTFDQAGSKLVKWEQRHNSNGANCMSILVLNSESSTDYAKDFVITVSNPAVFQSLALNKKSISLDLSTNNTYQLVAEGGNGTFSWSSSNDFVATVDNSGLVTSHANGKATITVTSGDLTATCEVVVSSCQLKFSEPYHIFENKNTYTPELTTKGVDKPEDIVWSSSDDEIATVSNGVITPVSGGCAEITATYDGVSASMKAVVVDDSNKLTGTKEVASMSSAVEITEPDKFFKFQTYVNTIEFVNDQLVITNNNKKVDTSSSSDRVQQIRYCVPNTDGTFYKGQYYLSCVFTNNTVATLDGTDPTNAKLTITNAANTNESEVEYSETGTPVKFGVVLSANGTGTSYLKMALKSFGYGTMTISDIHIVLMGE